MKKLLVLLVIVFFAASYSDAVKKKGKTKLKAKPKTKIVRTAPKVKTAAAKPKIIATFKDLPSSHPAYPYVIKVVATYEAMSAYPDGTFKAGKIVTRAELAGAIEKSLAYLEKTHTLQLTKDLRLAKSKEKTSRFQLAAALAGALRRVYDKLEVDLPSAEAVKLKDVKSKHWAAKDAALLSSFKIMSAFPDKTFKGSKNVTRLDVVYSLVRLVERAEVAIAEISPEKMLALQRKYAPPGIVVSAPPAPSRVEKSLVITSKPQAYLSTGWGNIFESASVTNNWAGFNFSGSYGDIFKLWLLSGNYEITGKYGFNQINYMVPSGGGGVSGGIVNENRYELEVNTIYPVVEVFGVSGKLLLGAKYINLSNASAPTNFTGFNAGLVTSARILDRKFLLRGFYSLPLARAQVSPSVLGQPSQLFDYEASVDLDLFSVPILFGFSGEIMLLSGGGNRFYNTLSLRYFLL